MRIASIFLALLAVAPAALADGQPAVRLARKDPVVVRGTAFHHRERLRVTVTVGSRPARTRHVRATRHGRFRLEFGGLQALPCGRVVIEATGAAGSHAVSTGTRHPNCIAD